MFPYITILVQRYFQVFLTHIYIYVNVDKLKMLHIGGTIMAITSCMIYARLHDICNLHENTAIIVWEMQHSAFCCLTCLLVQDSPTHFIQHLNNFDLLPLLDNSNQRLPVVNTSSLGPHSTLYLSTCILGYFISCLRAANRVAFSWRLWPYR